MVDEIFPYHSISDEQKWPSAAPWADFSVPINPHVNQIPKFSLDNQLKIVSAGSCFAQRISHSLQANNFNYLFTEHAPPFLPRNISQSYNYGVFSARFGNIYTARQLLQLVERCTGNFSPILKSWSTKDDTYIDPFRPRIQPDGFATEDELILDQQLHLEKVKDMFEAADVFIFTLGLTESWIDSRDGAVLPSCPGRGFGQYDPSIYKFHNMLYNEILNDLRLSVMKIRELNSDIKFIMTISPVPLAASMVNNHICLSNTYSKSVLRAAVGELVHEDEDVEYFGSYEILTHCFRNHLYWKDDMRSIKDSGLKAVFNSFYKYFASDFSDPILVPSEESVANTRTFPVIDCDEDELLRHLAR